MKKILIMAFVAAQLCTAASAADLGDSLRPESIRTGAFAGARLRISLDRQPRERVRAGLTLAPTLSVGRDRGPGRVRIGEGLEFGFSERRAPELSFGGAPLRNFAGGGEVAGGRRANISTIGWVAIGAVVVVVGYAAWFAHEMNRCGGDGEC